MKLVYLALAQANPAKIIADMKKDEEKNFLFVVKDDTRRLFERIKKEVGLKRVAGFRYNNAGHCPLPWTGPPDKKPYEMYISLEEYQKQIQTVKGSTNYLTFYAMEKA